MISWIQRTFQKHFKLVFLLLIAVMVIPMVFIYSASGGLGRGISGPPDVELFGQSFSSEQQRARLDRAASLSQILSRSQLTSSPYGRAALKHFADTFGVPRPTNTQLEQFIRTRPMFLGYDGQYNPQAYQQFRDNLRANVMGVSEAEVQQVLREDWRLEQVEKALVGPGYVADADVKRVFDERESLWSVQTASLDLTSIQTTAEPSAAELLSWFESHSFQYGIPEQVVVNYVQFTPTDYLPKVGEPTDDEIVAHFERNRAKYQKPAPAPAADGTTPAPAETTLADVREEVKTDVLQAKATAAAAREASEFATLLYDNEILPDTPAFDNLIEKHQLTIKAAPPFSDTEIPAGLAWDPAIVNAAFRLNEKNPVSDALRARDGTAVILFFRGLNPRTEVTLDQVRDRVVADVKADKRRLAVVARGEELQRQLSAAVAGGQPFADAAKATGLEVKSWEKFKVTAPPQDIDPAVLQNLSAQKERVVSQMAVQGERGTFVFATARELPDPAAAADTFNQVREAVMTQFAGLAGEIALDEVVRKERAAAGIPEESR